MEYKAPLFGAVTLVSGPETLLAERAVRGLTQQALAERPDASVTELEGAGVIKFDIIGQQNPNTIAATIALNFPDASGLRINQLIAGGLILFVITLAVNMLARWIVRRRAAFSGAN